MLLVLVPLHIPLCVSPCALHTYRGDERMHQQHPEHLSALQLQHSRNDGTSIHFCCHPVLTGSVYCLPLLDNGLTVRC